MTGKVTPLRDELLSRPLNVLAGEFSERFSKLVSLRSGRRSEIKLA